MEGIHTLLNNIYVLRKARIDRGFIYFNNERIIDTGTEAEPEYELSELVIDYEYKALAVHGYSVLVNLSKYPFRGLEDKADFSTFNKEELKKIINAALYELLMNGVTLPIIHDQHAELAVKIFREHSLKAIFIVDEGTVPEYSGLYYIYKRGQELVCENKKLGSIKDAACKPDYIRDNCLFLDLTNSYTYNLSLIINKSIKSLNDVYAVLEIFSKPYQVINIDKGYIDRQAKPDIIIYDLREPYLATPRDYLPASILRGYPPSQVFINGDTFFDHGESLVLTKPKIDFILEK